jgi:hypothetical protein
VQLRFTEGSRSAHAPICALGAEGIVPKRPDRALKHAGGKVHHAMNAMLGA